MTLLEGFTMYRPRMLTERECLVGMPLGTRCLRLDRVPEFGWRLWLATLDFKHGTYLELHNDGRIYRVTARDDEGDDAMFVRPSDDAHRSVKP